MASIVKRKSKYSVVYDYTDENGKRRQRWETFSTNAEAKKRKKQIEYEQDSGTFFIPTAKTLNDLLDEYMSIYGVNTWAMSIRPGRLWSCSGKNGCRCLLSHHRRGSLHKRSAIGGSILLIQDS